MHKIVDNFFENPHEVREIAIDLFKKNHSCILNDDADNYPGIRVDVPENIKNFIYSYLTDKCGCEIKKFSCDFCITSGVHKIGLVHRDKLPFAGLIYLNENAPEHSGTILCTPNTINIKPPIKLFKDASTTKNIEVIENFVKIKQNHNKNFDIQFELENKFNRLIFYSGHFFHAPYHYFGNNLFNSRLILVFWFDIE